MTTPPEENPEQQPLAQTGSPSRPMSRPTNTNWGRRTGGLGRAIAEPPDLRRYSTAPRYDLAAIADLVGVRAVTLWAWEQNLGIIVHDAAAENASHLRYSERDLIIFSWLRDQIVVGVEPFVAAQKLREAIIAAGGEPPPLPATPRTPSLPLRSNTSRLAGQAPQSVSPSLPLYPPAGQPGGSSFPPAPMPPSQPIPRPDQAGPPSRPMPPPQYPLSQPMSRPVDPLQNPQSQPITRHPSQPISRVGASRPVTPEQRASVHTAYEGGQVVSQTWVGKMPTATRDLRILVQPLVNAFASFDAIAATNLLDDAFASRSVETTCMTLITPALARIHELYMRRDETLPEGLFGLNTLRSRLFRLLDVLPENPQAPLAFIAAGPSEPHELEALLLALFWRRAGVRVVFFGQGISGQGLLESARKAKPRVVALTISTAARARMVAQVASEFARLATPHVNFCLVGDILQRDSALRKKMGGIYLGADAGEATQQIRQMLLANAGVR